MTGCACDCSCDGEYADVSSSKWVRGRKEYHCCECGEVIEVGERHQHDAGIWEGEWRHYRTCAPCARIRADFCTSWEYGSLREAFEQCFDFDYLAVEGE